MKEVSQDSTNSTSSSNLKNPKPWHLRSQNQVTSLGGFTIACLHEVGWHHSFDAPEWYSSTTGWQMLCFPCSNVFPWVFGTIATVLLKRHYREPQRKLILQPHPSFVFSELLLFAVFECHYGVQWFLTAFT